MAVGPSPLPVGLGCYATEGSSIIFVGFLLLIVYELGVYPWGFTCVWYTEAIVTAVIMVLTLWVGVKEVRHSRSPTVVALYRGCIGYCVSLSCEFRFLSVGRLS